jgi:hypothetical protein
MVVLIKKFNPMQRIIDNIKADAIRWVAASGGRFILSRFGKSIVRPRSTKRWP